MQKLKGVTHGRHISEVQDSSQSYSATIFQYMKMELQLQMSLLTFVLLWTLSFLPVLKAQEELPDVQVKIIKEAKKCDLKAEVGDHLKVHYTGRFDDENGKIFDSSRDRGNLFSFQLGAGQVSIQNVKNAKILSACACCLPTLVYFG